MSSKEISQVFQKILTLKEKDCEGITGIRYPDPQKKTEYEELIRRITKLRGRSLFYDYIGSGRGHGPYVELLDGSVKLDFICGIGVHLLGHAHPTVLEATLSASLSDLLMQGHLQMNGESVAFSEKVIQLAKGSRLVHGWVCPSGSMANENALKILRQKNSPARKILAMEDSFAGRTTMMAEITDNPKYKEGLPSYNEVLRVPFYDKKDPGSTEKKSDCS